MDQLSKIVTFESKAQEQILKDIGILPHGPVGRALIHILACLKRDNTVKPMSLQALPYKWGALVNQLLENASADEAEGIYTAGYLFWNVMGSCLPYEDYNLLKTHRFLNS